MPEDDVFDITLPLPEAPPSPSKRPRSRCHYSDVESSPSKKSREGATAPREPVHFEERGLLFGNTTNAKPRPAPMEDDFDLGENITAAKVAKKGTSRTRSTKMQVEVVLEPKRKRTTA